MAAATAELRRVFPADRDAPTAARRAVADLAADFDPETQFRLELLVTELVSNSFAHADGARIGLRVHADPQQVHVTVLDEGPGFDPDRVGSVDGFGLVLLSQLADRWGADRGGGRSAVWFLLRRTHRSGAAAAAVQFAGRFAATLLGRRRQAPVDPYSD